jgi:DNA (cytosine-5)-methyltransferase 1
MTLRIGSLCTGYGGLDMAAQAVFGGELTWWADVDPGPIAVMQRHHPGVPNLGDLKAIDWSAVERVDLLTAGYPCQPFSNAGKRLGTQDPRHLWPYVAKAVGAIRPLCVVLENVAAHLRRGFDVVLQDLAEIGYDATWVVVRASDVGAPHRRERLFVVTSDAARECEHRPGNAGESGRREHTDGGLTAADASGNGEGSGLQTRDETGSRPADSARRGSAAADASGDGRHQGRAEPARLIGGSDVAVSGAPAADTLGEPVREQPGRLGRPDGTDQAEPGHAGQAAADTHSFGYVETLRPATGETDWAHNPTDRRNRTSGQVEWGHYAPAVERWERISGRPAPEPTETSQRGARVLSPRFVEWLMGLPAGHVTDTEGLTRNAQLKLLGNGVIPRQAEHALRELLASIAWVARRTAA